MACRWLAPAGCALFGFLLLWGLAGCHPDEPGPPPEPPHPEVSWQKPAAVPVEPETEPEGAPLSAEETPPGAVPSVDTLPASSVLTFPLEEPRAYYHEVQKGESLSLIGKKYGLTAPQLLAANGLDPGALLQPGQLIYIPGKVPE